MVRKINTENETLWVNYLRSFITFLVVVHHSALAYTTYARFDSAAYIRSTHAIVDNQRWIGLDILVNFNDTFFMSLMFFISGLFLLKSIQKKGITTFIRDRFYRLFVPFILGGTTLMLLAYYPSYYMAHSENNILGYIIDFFTVQQWPVGPPWFIWILFLFNLVFAIFFSLTKRRLENFGKTLFSLNINALKLIIIWYLFTWIVYVPLAYNVGAGTWTGFGPFDFQLSRVLLYFGYFVFGILIGNADFNNMIFSAESEFVKKWWLWSFLAILVFVLLTMIAEPLRQLVLENKIDAFYTWMIYYSIFVASCTFSCIAFLTSFKALISSPKFLWNSLSDNAYMIYLVHFVFVTWCQFFLLGQNIPAILKFSITFIVAILGSWIFSIVIRKNKMIRKYV